ncbi:DUF1501 domain-containing protein [Opitutus sp. ER46]|uniref:DUF1501 domain-containing protein n=1 Tax=Opitutus sp. ER46 TaxID=2161864 RepID=UPI000D31195B|nr:DUF1501 domain-containing protein [Opitutus sp. ER46]PTX96486.1 hypothetical protein DB354_07445 [Opitutus sp. ER46]
MTPLTHPLTRRSFIHGLGATLAISALPGGSPWARAADGRAPNGRCSLVLIQLAGGLDAFDVLVPYGSSEYARLRPTLALGRGEVTRLDDAVALNRTCAPLGRLWDDGLLLFCPAVGWGATCPTHFRATEIWQTAPASPEQRLASGWLGRTAQQLEHAGVPVSCWRGTRAEPRVFVRSPDAGAPGRGREVSVPLDTAGGPLPRLLAEAAECVGTTDGVELVFLAGGGFDTHFAQRETGARPLAEFAGALADFQRRIQRRVVADRVLTVVFSEFGRTAAENAQGGTEHGRGALVMLAGTRLTGRRVPPTMTLAAPPDGRADRDYRAVYASVLRDWLSVPIPAVLSGADSIRLMSDPLLTP